jgi:hypothetical protein
MLTSVFTRELNEQVTSIFSPIPPERLAGEIETPMYPDGPVIVNMKLSLGSVGVAVGDLPGCVPVNTGDSIGPFSVDWVQKDNCSDINKQHRMTTAVNFLVCNIKKTSRKNLSQNVYCEHLSNISPGYRKHI